MPPFLLYRFSPLFSFLSAFNFFFLSFGNGQYFFVPGTSKKNICEKFQYRHTKDRSVVPPPFFHTLHLSFKCLDTLGLSSFVTEVVKWKQGHRSIVCRRGTIYSSQVPLRFPIGWFLPAYSLFFSFFLFFFCFFLFESAWPWPLHRFLSFASERLVRSLWRSVCRHSLFIFLLQLACLHSSFPVFLFVCLYTHAPFFFLFLFFLFLFLFIYFFSHRVFFGVKQSPCSVCLSVCLSP